MATTSSNLVAGKAIGGQGSNGSNRRYGLKAKVLASVAILSCAAALTIGGLRVGNSAETRPLAPLPTHLLPAGTDDLNTTGCIGTVGPFACQFGQSLAGTDDLVTDRCVGSAEPFACQVGQSLAGTDDLAPDRCVGSVGPFACPTAPALPAVPATYIDTTANSGEAIVSDGAQGNCVFSEYAGVAGGGCREAR
jgi:hypothetical protein